MPLRSFFQAARAIPSRPHAVPSAGGYRRWQCATDNAGSRRLPAPAVMVKGGQRCPSISRECLGVSTKAVESDTATTLDGAGAALGDSGGVARPADGVQRRWKPIPAPPGPEPIPVAVPDEASPSWTSSVWASSIDVKRRIFCNRSLNMKSIVAVGFDMDYTLAQYRSETFETMAYKETLKKLVTNLGYPEELLQWEFDWRYMVRGLVLDKKRGNVIKMDRHKYVKVAYHGFAELSREERMETYNNTTSRESYDEPDFALIDTLFSLAEAYLFAQLVEFKDSHLERVPSGHATSSYATIYRNVREAVDMCHRDGTLKREVAVNPGKYIYKDDQIVPMLQQLRTSGRMTFLVTNSLWDYTHVVMNYLCGKCGTSEGTPRDDQWLELFDLAITGSMKPSFFLDGSRASLFEVEVATGKLLNTDNGSPLPQIGAVGLGAPLAEEKVSQGCRVFQGGSVAQLHRLLKIESGSQVLYVGDHIYGDILRSKKQIGWRTMLVVPELEREVQVLWQTQHVRAEFHRLRQQRDALDDSIQRLEWALCKDRKLEETEAERERIRGEIAILKEQKDAVREKHRAVMRQCHMVFHSVWGQLMKTGYQNSRFAHQVERFACLYTSNVANLVYYSPDKSYRTSEDFMPHELAIVDLEEAKILNK